jgi:cytosine/creatinine deaminase
MVAQMTSTVLTNATLIDGKVTKVRIDDGVIVAIGDESTDVANDVDHVDLDGYLLLTAAVEPHAHLDKAFLAELVPNPTGDLMGAIEAMQANRHVMDTPGIVERAERAARLMAANGYSAIRTHADLTVEHGLRSVEALAEVRRRVADLIDIEIVALAGWPICGDVGADTRALLREALDRCRPRRRLPAPRGVLGWRHRVGDRSAARDRDRPRRRRRSPHRRDARPGGERPRRPGPACARRVRPPATASHCVSLGVQSESQQRETAERVAAAGVHVIALPHTNLFLQGRGHAPMPRGLTAIPALRAAGANVAAGADNLQDPFNPVGRACPFETAGLMIMAAHDLPDQAWRSVSEAPAKALGRRAELAVGAPADLVAVRAATVREAIAFGPSDRIVWRRGARLG